MALTARPTSWCSTAAARLDGLGRRVARGQRRADPHPDRSRRGRRPRRGPLGRWPDDYLVKPFAVDELLARAGAAAGRGPAVGSELRLGDLTQPHHAYRQRGGRERPGPLGSRFCRCSSNTPARCGPASRCSSASGLRLDGESNVLDVYVGHLRSKLEAGGEPRLLHTVRGVGYVLREAAARAPAEG